MKKAFTLVETVLAVGLFAMMATISSVLLFGVVRGAKKASATALVRNEGSYAMNQMVGMLRYAVSVESGTCSSSSISFVSITNLGSITTFSLSGTRIASNSANLTSSKVEVSPFLITCPGVDKTVGITFTVKPAGSGGLGVVDSATTTFDSQVVLRNL